LIFTGVLIVGIKLLLSSSIVANIKNDVKNETSSANGSSSTAALSTSAAPASNGSLTLITEPQNGMAPIYKLISSAHSSLDMTMYELTDVHAEHLLVADKDRGVNVRVLLNCGYQGKKESKFEAAYKYLQAHDVSVKCTPNYFALTHQKTITVDNKVSAIMTLNLTSQYYKTSRDFALLDRNPADVKAIIATFNNDWNENKVKASSATDLVWSPGSQDAQVHLIDSAHHSLWVENEEMDSKAIEAALESAARRHVDVHVIMTYSSNWSEAFSALQQAGVHIGTYAENAPLYIHAKIIVADGERFFLGSENFSSASLDYNRELGLITSSHAISGELVRILSADYKSSES
jgi:phosphatidylserine/phosphatidylglycerophosphate/cardiolipin synthase-like enzyme